MKPYTLIGIDGGATKVSALEIIVKENSFYPGNVRCEKKYSDITGFIPSFKAVDINIQLTQRNKSTIQTDSEELQMETVFVEACAQCVEEIAGQSESNAFVLGIGMPGLKTEDKRGIAVLANGPRMLRYANLLENRLKSAGVELISPLKQLGSDADYCGIGENYAANGAFKNVQNAYYIGGGTGIADALKLHGRLYPFDVVKEWMAKSWELKSTEGKSIERYCSSNGIQSIYAALQSRTVEELNHENIYPGKIAERAVERELAAVQTFLKVTDTLSRLIFSRITTLAYGWRNEFEFVNPAREPLAKTHGRIGTHLDKIILGQRLGELLNTNPGKEILFLPLKEKLANLISDDKELSVKTKHYYEKLDDILVISQLREAPALGAGIDAFLNLES
jgi:predicted NBD/HSP70 family sugar kinase